LLPISQNTALFSLLGTNYGGNGQTTFALPDLRGRVMIHQGTGPGQPTYVIGETGGNTQQTLLVSNLPPHNHALMASTDAATTEKPAGAFLAAANDPASLNPINVYGPATNTTMNPLAIGFTGNGIPISLLQPFLTISVCIALQGIFPSRN
jgi:microcystin-dependent protein